MEDVIYDEATILRGDNNISLIFGPEENQVCIRVSIDIAPVLGAAIASIRPWKMVTIANEPKDPAKPRS